MWKNLILIGFVILLSSCGAKRKGLEASKESKEVILGKSEAVSYKSLGNGVASISLQLFENNTFKFDFKSIPQPESTEKPVVISEKGTYISDGNWKILSFKNPKFLLSAIFDSEFASDTDFKIIDKETVKINTSKSALPIWGVICEKL
ncbi:MAG: hypothetical protein CL530_08535 [Aequorivita sp.]|mgnify:CR=1 FL=1|nr:hypothetical protein [Aequorivita sp.]|tara:strand:- start:1235 stop:1678 length:444 start_codon:yes stop_codon:yes gene_type:complete